VLVAAVALGMVLQPTMDKVGSALGEAIFLHQSVGRLLRALSQVEPIVLCHQPALPLPFTKTITAITRPTH
jgi:hypothetical protein